MLALNILDMMDLGLISRLILTKPIQVKSIRNVSIADTIFQLLQKMPKGGAVEATIRAIPPCFEANFLENTKYKILLKTLKEKLIFYHIGMPTNAIVSPEKCPLQQQISAYRAYVKAYEEDLDFLDEGYLIAEDFNYHRYLDTNEDLELYLQSLSFKNADNRLTQYFYKNRAKNFAKEYWSNGDKIDEDNVEEDLIVTPAS